MPRHEDDLLGQLLRWWRAEMHLDQQIWEHRVERDVVSVSHFIGLSAIAAFAVQVELWGARDSGYVGGKLGLMLLATAGLFIVPSWVQRAGRPQPAALWWGGLTLLSALLDRAAGRDLIDVMWSLIPGYLGIAVIGFFVRNRVQLAWLLGFASAAAATVWGMPRGVEMQVGMVGMVLALGGYTADLYRRSVIVALEVERMSVAHVQQLARVLPEPIVEALGSEAELHELMRPTESEVCVVSMDVRGSTGLLMRLGSHAYLDAVRPMITELYTQARRLDAFAKFEGDGILVIFGVFDHRPVTPELMATVLGFLDLADRCAAQTHERLLRDTGESLHVGMGVAAGTIVSGSVASLDREVMFDVVGEPVAYACRVEATTKQVAKQPDGSYRNCALLTADLMDLVRDRAEFRPVADASVRDFGQRQQLWEVVLPSARAPRDERADDAGPEPTPETTPDGSAP